MRYGLAAGSPMDFATGYDFTIVEHREHFWKKVKKEAPLLLIRSPPCGDFSMLQELNIAIRD